MLRIIYKLSQFKNNFRTHFFLFNDTTTTDIYTLSLHDALPISRGGGALFPAIHLGDGPGVDADRIRRAAVDSAGRRLHQALPPLRRSGRHRHRPAGRTDYLASTSSVDVDGDAGNEVGVAGREEADDARLIHRLRHAAQRHLRRLACALFRGHRVPARAQSWAEREAGGDRVHGDAVRAELERELPGERDDPALGGGVGAAARRAQAAARDRREVDDLPTALTLHHAPPRGDEGGPSLESHGSLLPPAP